MIILVPVSRFRVRYEVATGAPYSQLERLILLSVSEGLCSIDELVSAFRIHPRLIIQSLVTLTHAGWVALGSSQVQQFVLTADGQRALNEEKMPEALVVKSRETNILLERITGAAIPQNEVIYVTRSVLEKQDLWTSCPRLNPLVFDNRLDEGQIQHLLPRQRGQRIHWVASIEMINKNVDFIPVDVDLEHGTLLNLPQRLEARLRPYIVERAHKVLLRAREEEETLLDWDDLEHTVPVSKLGTLDVPSPNLPVRDVVIPWSNEIVLFTREQHDALIEHVFVEAKTSVFISSGTINTQRLEQLKTVLVGVK